MPGRNDESVGNSPIRWAAVLEPVVLHPTLGFYTGLAVPDGFQRLPADDTGGTSGMRLAENAVQSASIIG
jgi:hypothetical protein